MIKTLMKNIFTPLLTRIQALEYSMGLIADYIVETGTATASDGSTWVYTKMASGIAECSGTKTETLSQYNTMGSSYGMWWLYYSDVYFPFEFTVAPNAVANACVGGRFTLTTIIGTETDHVRVFGGIHDSSGSLAFTSRVYVVGTWK